MDDLLDAVRAVCAEGRRQGVAGSDGLLRMEQALDGLGPRRAVAGRSLPVIEAELTRAAEAADDPLARGLAEAVQRHAGDLTWFDGRAGYGEDPSLAQFFDGYGAACFLGPDFDGIRMPYASDNLLIGFSLQAPGLHYPAHAHPAVELYYVIGGTVEWQQGDGLWRHLGPGAFVLHESEEPHAMQTGEKPLLAMFAWLSDLLSPVRFVEPPAGV
jgi:hypothetical protein